MNKARKLPGNFSLFDRDPQRSAAQCAELARYQIVSTDGQVALCRDHAGRLVCLGKLDDGKTYLAVV